MVSSPYQIWVPLLLDENGFMRASDGGGSNVTHY